MKTGVGKSEKEFCCHRFITIHKGIRLKCSCWLDKDHVGEHECGICCSFPIELHPYEGEEEDEYIRIG